jgi:hypothetical protein
VIWRNPYTQWRKLGRQRLICVGDTSDDHEAYIDGDQYYFVVRGSGRTAPATDKGIICYEGLYHRGDVFAQMCLAMELEFIMGVFVAALWAPSFPRRTARLAEKYRVIVAAALSDRLPPVLADVAAAYLW